MAVRSRKARPAQIQDFLEADQRCVALESFHPRPVSSLVERGSYYPLDHPLVRAHPELFAVLVPAVDVLDREITR